MSTQRPGFESPRVTEVAGPMTADCEVRPGVVVSRRTWLPTEAGLEDLLAHWRPDPSWSGAPASDVTQS